ncbi:enoyl-CoA hydratase/isomerase family protein [Acinetobacter oleivorans]|uniref:enoyl-CoA hydratase/isomerase family protein n=1 Tax=Acinetobacter oleivorans TaxID=1148157 RepID=UPI0015809E6F|nr:enoyl-CoA hydratase/isomerase family protein [Acinetobacter oleivorans]NUG02764.1 enoyl-CoA hydratase/isomerase family protein [Acinetobacter oleivorans]
MIATLNYQDDIAIITLCRPEARNALNKEMIQNIDDLLNRVIQSPPRVLIFTGQGEKAFCAGADITELQNKTPKEYLELSRKGQNVFNKISNLPFPTLAVIKGAALGGGLELAMACTFRICSLNSKFGLPEIKLGLLPGYGGTQRLPRIVGYAKALELTLSGRIFDAHEAKEIGLITQITATEDSVQAGLDFLSSFGESFPASTAFIIKAVQSALDLNITDGLTLESEMFLASTQTKDATEGIEAFIEKRKAEFTNQ